MIRLLSICVVITTHYLGVFAQTDLYSSLTQGDIVPDVVFTIWQKGKEQKVKLSDYRGKLIILDFWGVHCSQCIPGVSKLAELQNQFKKEILVLLVTSDSKMEVENLWEKLRRNNVLAKHAAAGEQSAIVTSDTLFKKLFPYEGQPTHVWIDEQQHFLRMTSGSSTTALSIRMQLKGETFSFEDEQKLIGLDKTNPLSWINNLGEFGINLKYYSFIMSGPFGRARTGIPMDYTPTAFNFILDSLTKTIVGFSCMNNPIISLYKIAYLKSMPEFVSIPLNRILVESENKGRFFHSNDSEVVTWIKSNTFSYAMKIPNELSESIYDIMRQDIDRYFELKSGIEKRKVKCIVLKRIRDSVGFVTPKNKEVYQNGVAKSGANVQFCNVGIEVLLDYLKRNFLSNNKCIPFLNETNYFGTISMQLPLKETGTNIGFQFIQTELEKAGLTIGYEFRELDMLVIKDKR